MNRKGAGIIPKSVLTAGASTYINKDATKMQGWMQPGDNAYIFASLRFVQHQFQCFSAWDKQDMKAFWDFLEKLHNYTWRMLYNQAGKSDKSGLAYTPMSFAQYPECVFKESIEPTITIFELRVSDKSRVHCFRNNSVCYICWLDRNHEIG